MKLQFLKTLIIGAALTASCLGNVANANIIVLDFEGISNSTSVDDFYNGGTDGTGNSGVNYGVSFSSNTLALIDEDAGGSGNFANEPSGSTAMFFTTGSSAILNFAAGFDTGFSFFYTSSAVASVNVFDDVNGDGNLLGSINLAAQFSDNCNGDPYGNFCNWTSTGINFAGIAKSIDFSGTVSQVAFDDITLGSEVAGEQPTDVPEPSTLAIFALGIMGLVSRRFAKK